MANIMTRVTGIATREDVEFGKPIAKVSAACGIRILLGVHIPAKQRREAEYPFVPRLRYDDIRRGNIPALSDVEGCCNGGNGEGDGQEKDSEELHGSREYRNERCDEWSGD